MGSLHQIRDKKIDFGKTSKLKKKEKENEYFFKKMIYDKNRLIGMRKKEVPLCWSRGGGKRPARRASRGRKRACRDRSPHLAASLRRGN